MAMRVKRMRVTAWSYYELRSRWPDAVGIKQDGLRWVGYVTAK